MSEQVEVPRARSVGEEAFALHCRAEKLTPEREYRISDKTKHRFDFAFVEQRILVEIQGSTWTGGRHTRGKGYEADCRKANLAVFLGWRLLRYTTEMVLAGDAINDVLALLSIP
jgi:very-short-patch-repair endonuclease